MLRRFALLVLSVLAVAFVGVIAAPASAESRLSWRHLSASSSVKPKPKVIVVPNCEDMTHGPVRCVMFDEGWVLVKSWDPFRSVKTRKCKSAKTPLPCFKRTGDRFRVRLAR